MPSGRQFLDKELGTCGKAARGRNFLREVKPRLSNSSSGPRPAAAGKASVGPGDSSVIAEPGALLAAVHGPQALPQNEGQSPGGAAISLDESHRLSEPQFPHWHHGRAAISAWRGCSEIQRGHACQAGAGFIIIAWRTEAARGCS